jgi:hypothetical protein
MSEAQSWLSDAEDWVTTAQGVLSDVERGLEVVERAEVVAKRSRPFLRLTLVLILGCLVGLGIYLVARKRREGQSQVPHGALSEDDD